MGKSKRRVFKVLVVMGEGREERIPIANNRFVPVKEVNHTARRMGFKEWSYEFLTFPVDSPASHAIYERFLKNGIRL